MKKLILTLFMLTTVLTPALVMAETGEEPDYGDQFLYVFYLSYRSGILEETQHFDLSTGDPPPFPTGQWSLNILDSRDAVRYTQSIDPAALVQYSGALKVPHHYSGKTAVFIDPAGNSALAIDLSGSNVCDDDGSCQGEYGEESFNCPGDCGAYSESSPQVQTAAIASQVSGGRRLGTVLMRLSLAGAGVMLLVGLSQMLDSRRRS